jgi:branched-subunit amino acid aminotransferase/4-amino-4-deoxychorismate lyase
MKIFFNGNYYAENKSLLKVFNRGLLFGDGIFTTLKVENSVPLFLDHHIARLRSSCQFFGIKFSDPGLPGVIGRLLKINRLKNARIKIMVSRGCDFKNRVYNYEGEPPTMLVLAFPLIPQPLRPVGLCISPELRGNESIYQHKTISYLSNLTHKTFAQKNGFSDAIILNCERQVLETSTANLFVIIKDKIITPPKELPLLNGIMRQNLLSLGAIKTYGFLEDSLTKKDLKKVEGAFITSAILEICPVKRIEDQEFSPEKPKVILKEWRCIRDFCLQKG